MTRKSKRGHLVHYHKSQKHTKGPVPHKHGDEALEVTSLDFTCKCQQGTTSLFLTAIHGRRTLMLHKVNLHGFNFSRTSNFFLAPKLLTFTTEET